MKTTVLDTPGPQYGHPWLPIAMRGIVFVTNRVPTADLGEIPQPYCMVFRCASFGWPQHITDTLSRYQNTILTNPKTINKISETLKSQNQEK